MKKLVKIIILQVFWYIAVMYGHLYQYPILVASLIFALANFFIYRPSVTLKHYPAVLLIFVLYGMAQEWLFQEVGLVDYNQDSFPWWLTSLYIVFIAYYGDLFNYLEKKSLLLHFVMGAVGGIAAYYGGAKISPIQVQSSLYYLAVGISWGIFFPLSIKIFYSKVFFKSVV
ncbi:MAG: hypothetical protein OHK0056_26050 [Bacteriovoracaceae bacterium]